jgi:hypothetical protein
MEMKTGHCSSSLDAVLLPSVSGLLDGMKFSPHLLLCRETTVPHLALYASARHQADQREVSPLGITSRRLLRLTLFTRLDAVEDLMRHETFEADFVGLVKGMPDLERIVSRVHAGTCKIKDFLKILDVSVAITLRRLLLRC